MTKTEKAAKKAAKREAFKAAWLAKNPKGEVIFDGTTVYLRKDKTVQLDYNYLTYRGETLEFIAERNNFTF